MKKFQVHIKNPDEDFILTDDLWLTFGEHTPECRILKFYNKAELIICVYRSGSDPSIKPINRHSLLPLYRELQKLIQDGAVFYFNSHEQTCFFHNPHEWTTIVVKRSRNSILFLEQADGNIAINREDLVIVLNHSLKDPEKLHGLQDLVTANKTISYSLFSEIEHFIHENHVHAHTIFTADFSDHQAYIFPIKSSLKTVSLTIDMIKNKILKYHTEKIWQIETVLHEALVNAITYGNELVYEKQVTVSYEIGTKGLRTLVRDCGEGFDVNNISVPVGVEALERISGRGIYIMQKFTDAIYYNPIGNEVLLFFNF